MMIIRVAYTKSKIESYYCALCGKNHSEKHKYFDAHKNHRISIVQISLPKHIYYNIFKLYIIEQIEASMGQKIRLATCQLGKTVFGYSQDKRYLDELFQKLNVEKGFKAEREGSYYWIVQRDEWRCSKVRKFSIIDLFELWKRGYTDTEMGKILGVSRATVAYRREKVNLPYNAGKCQKCSEVIDYKRGYNSFYCSQCNKEIERDSSKNWHRNHKEYMNEYMQSFRQKIKIA